jgi:predicted metalloprotease
VLPGFAYYDDHDGENAYATTARRLSRSDGSVLFGKRCFLTLMSEPEHPEVGVAAVCAHEFGHILQFKLNLFARLDSGQRTVKRSELHADYLAGFFAGRRKLEKPDFPAAVFATTKFASGDYDVHDPQHHGTPQERAAAVVRGFEVGHRERRNLSDAVQIGINYVSRL